MAEGWIKISRKLEDNWLWKAEPFSYGQAWVDLILLANYEDKKAVCDGSVVLCKRGDVNLSYTALGKRWGWDRRKVSRFISLLEKDGMVSTNVTTHRTIITLVNYGNYQVPLTTELTTDETTDGLPMDITNKRKKEKNIKKFKPANKFEPSLKQDYDFEQLERILSE